MEEEDTYDVTFESVTPKQYLALFTAIKDYHREAHHLEEAGVFDQEDVDISHDLIDYMLEVDEDLVAKAEDLTNSEIEDLAGRPTGNPVVDMFRAMGGTVDIVVPDDPDF